MDAIANGTFSTAGSPLDVNATVGDIVLGRHGSYVLDGWLDDVAFYSR